MCLCDACSEQGGPMGLLPASPRERLLPLELEEALEQRKAVMLEYLDSQGNRTLRTIEPALVRRRGGQLVLIAHCQLRNDRRTFNLERIVRLTRIELPHPMLPMLPVQLDLFPRVSEIGVPDSVS